MKSTRVVLAVVVALVVGGAAGWAARSRYDERVLEQVALAHDLERVATSASGLGALAADAPEKLDRLLWRGLETGLARAEERVRAGIRLPDGLAAPNLMEGIRRAEVLAERSDLPDLAGRLAELRASLGGAS